MAQKYYSDEFATGHDGRRFGRWPLGSKKLPKLKGEINLINPIQKPASGGPKFQPLPDPSGPEPYELGLEKVVSEDTMTKITDAGKLVFHLTGDVGGAYHPEPQQLVAEAMEKDFKEAGNGDEIDPSFLYIVGDVVYYYGETGEYYPQFYKPYASYPAPIFAIPGNHDGMVSPCCAAPSLKAFMDNFCAFRAWPTFESVDTGRAAMTQPNCYWTLITPYVTLVGLYTNVVNGGELDDDQVNWLKEQLKKNKDKPLILTMHYPAISFDALHPGSQYMENYLNDAIKKSERFPDMVIGGHSHNYQRFTRTATDDKGNREIPYIVAGGGGFWDLTAVKDAGGNKLPIPLGFDVKPDPDKEKHPSPFETKTTLARYVDDQYGYLRLTVDNKKNEITGDYITVSSPKESWQPHIKTDEIFLKDSFTLKLKDHTVATNPMPPPG
ncbi:MAG: metallophosphoesterase family protein [Pseudonocardiaceae bacterium]